MPTPDYQKKANKKWSKAHYEKIYLSYPKGTRDAWKSEAEKRGMALADLIRTAVNEYLDNH